MLFFRRVRITFRQEERTELIVCDRKGQSLGTKVAVDCCKTVACTVVDVCTSAAVVEPFTDGLQERRMQRSSMMLLVEAERSSRSRRESQRICNSSVSWELKEEERGGGGGGGGIWRGENGEREEERKERRT